MRCPREGRSVIVFFILAEGELSLCLSNEDTHPLDAEKWLIFYFLIRHKIAASNPRVRSLNRHLFGSFSLFANQSPSSKLNEFRPNFSSFTTFQHKTSRG
jgi:hypothetical protein